MQEIDTPGTDQVDDPVLLGQTTRPGPRRQIAKRFRFANSGERVPKHRVYDLQYAQGDTPVSPDPPRQVLPEFWMENRLPRGL